MFRTTVVSLNGTVTGSATFKAGADLSQSDLFLAGNLDDSVFFSSSTGNDTIGGFAGNDTIFTGSGNDLIFPGRGNDSVRGGLGNDTVFYNSAIENYTFSYDINNKRIIVNAKMGSVAELDGTDNIEQVEKFKFVDSFFRPLENEIRFKVFAINTAVTGQAPTTTRINDTSFEIGSTFNIGKYVDDQIASLGNVPSLVASTIILRNLKITAQTIPTESFNALNSALSIFFDAFPSAKGQVVLNLVGLLKGLEANPVYGNPAKELNSQIDSVFGADFNTTGITLIGVPSSADDRIAAEAGFRD